MPTSKYWTLAVLLLLFAALALAGTMDAKDAGHAKNTYCEMVAYWDRDTESGIAPEQRAGWPPFDGRKQCKTEE